MLTLEQLRARHFVLTDYPSLGLTHVGPGPVKNLKRAAWATEDLPYRSVVLDYGTGRVVSAGFPKFFNYGEGGPSHIENSRVRKALGGTGPPATSTEKIDGSLAIRFVHDGRVLWRTRGTLNRTDMVEAIEEVALKYPALAEPRWLPETSVLFEFVHPGFQVVLRYPEPDLILVGAVRHEDFYIWTPSDLDRIVKEADLNRAPENLCGADIDGLLHSIEHRRGSEGIVLRCGPLQQTLVKFKSADYLMRHRLRFALNAKTIRQICIENHMTAMEDFDKWLDEQGADWELIQDVKPLVETFMTYRRIAAYSFADLGASVGRAMREYHGNRRDFAVEFANKLSAAEKTAAFLLLDGKKTQAWEKFRDSMLDAAFEKFDKLEASVLDF